MSIKMPEAPPFFSIVTPSFNSGKFIKTTIESVLAQRYPSYEHIIIDAESTDETYRILAAYVDHATIKWVSEKDRGQSDAINKGVRRASGNWILWLNADDVLLKGALQSFSEAISKHRYADVFYGHQMFMDEQGFAMKTVYHLPFRDRLVRYGRYLPPSSGSLFRRDLLLKEPLSEKFHFLMDKEWFLRCGPKLRAIRVNRVLSGFRVYDMSKTGVSISGGEPSPRQQVEGQVLESLFGGKKEKSRLVIAVANELCTLLIRIEYLLRKSRFSLAYAVNSGKAYLGHSDVTRLPLYEKDCGFNITYIASFSGLGGAERATLRLAEWQEESSHHVYVHLLKPVFSRDFLSGFAGAVEFRESGYRGALRSLKRLWCQMARSDVVISASEFTPTFVGYCFARLHRKPFIAEVHTHLSAVRVSVFQKLLARIVYPWVPWIRTVSSALADDLVEEFGVGRSRVRVVYNAFDLESVHRLSAIPIDHEHESLFEGIVIVAVGRLVAQKRFDLAIDTLFLLREKHGIRARLVIIGEGELRGSLSAYASERGVLQDVSFIGFVENPFRYLVRARALLLSSDYEGFGRVIVEAMAVGCPVVSTCCPSGPSEILGNGVFGVLVPVGSAEGMALGLARVLRDDRLATEISTLGRRRAQDFSVNQIAPEYMQLIQEVIGVMR